MSELQLYAHVEVSDFDGSLMVVSESEFAKGEEGVGHEVDEIEVCALIKRLQSEIAKYKLESELWKGRMFYLVTDGLDSDFVSEELQIREAEQEDDDFGDAEWVERIDASKNLLEGYPSSGPIQKPEEK